MMIKVKQRQSQLFIKKSLKKDVIKLKGAGAAGGLGAGLVAFAKARMKSGVDIVIDASNFYKHIKNADLVITGEGRVDSQTAFGKTPSIIQTNVTEKKDLKNLFSIINKEYGKLDGAFNNSGILENPNHLHDIQEEEFWDLVKTNIYGTWMCMKNEINLMLKRKSGSIVNCSSINGLKGNPKHPIYSATKHAIIGLTKSAAISYAKKSIRVNAVSPGPTETKMMTKIDQSIPEKKQSINNWIPLGRYARPEEIAESVIWLLSNKSNYITGSVISIDGGVSAS